MKLTQRQILKIHDFALKYYLDKKDGSCEDVVNAWLSAINDVLHGDGYEIYVKKVDDSSDDTNSYDRIRL